MWYSDDFLDALQETLNVGVGKAAKSLSEMIGPDSEVDLTVPRVTMRALDREQHFKLEDSDIISCVKQNFEGAIRGNSFLVFPEDQSLELIRLILGNEVPAKHVSDLESEALCEIGNIILNAALSCLAELLDAELLTHVPKVLTGNWQEIFSTPSQSAKTETPNAVLYMDVSFRLLKADLSGCLGFVLDVESSTVISKAIESLISSTEG